jgi:hypothetical protein
MFLKGKDCKKNKLVDLGKSDTAAGFPRTSAMNYPAASYGVSKDLYDNFPNVVTPECFYRRSRSGLAWIPA